MPRMSSTFQYHVSQPAAIMMRRNILIALCFSLQCCLAFQPRPRSNTTKKPRTVKEMFQQALKKPGQKLMMAVTENGCPFVFDFGQLGDIRYMPHDICFNRRFPPYLNPQAAHPEPSGEVSIVLDLFPGMSDTYRVTVTVNNPKTTKFRIWDLVLWNENVDLRDKKPAILSVVKSAGYFEVKDNFMPICCDFLGGMQIRDTIRFINTQNKRLEETFVRFVPLNFKGKVQFLANIISTRLDYIAKATSEVYDLPFSTQNVDDLPYDEDWPEDSTGIPQY